MAQQPQTISRSDAWRLQYRRDRYARHLSKTELNERFRDILLNILQVSDDAKFGIRPMEIQPGVIGNETTVWMEKMTHVLEELAIRYGPSPGGFERDVLRKEPLPDFASELARKAVKRLALSGTAPKGAFIKFGKRRYMEQLYEEGGLRIQPAAFFAETNHNQAIRDDELTNTFSVAISRDEVMKLVTNPEDVPPDFPDQCVNAVMEYRSDYWIYCVSSAIEARLFVDYDAEACVIIKDRERFVRLLGDVGTRNLHGIPLRHGPADYVDPILPKTPHIFVPFAKHFKYTYQNEYRFCWLPPVPTPKVQHVDVRLGSLKDFSDLIVL